jgi:hypothetical protein
MAADYGTNDRSTEVVVRPIFPFHHVHCGRERKRARRLVTRRALDVRVLD